LGVPHIFGRKIVGGTVSPQPLHRKTILRRFVSAAMAAGAALADLAMRHAH
jgi:hypothetical protein